MGPSIKEQQSNLGDEFRFGRTQYLKAQRKKRTLIKKKKVFCFIVPNILIHKYRKCAQFMDYRTIQELDLRIKVVIESHTQDQAKRKTDFSTRIRATTSLCFVWLKNV